MPQLNYTSLRRGHPKGDRITWCGSAAIAAQLLLLVFAGAGEAFKASDREVSLLVLSGVLPIAASIALAEYASVFKGSPIGTLLIASLFTLLGAICSVSLLYGALCFTGLLPPDGDFDSSRDFPPVMLAVVGWSATASVKWRWWLRVRAG